MKLILDIDKFRLKLDEHDSLFPNSPLTTLETKIEIPT